LVDRNIRERLRCAPFAERRQARRAPGEARRNEQAHFIHYSGFERGLIQSRPRFEHRAQNFAASEFVEHGAKIQASAARRHAHDFDACGA
jgi:hypothetical protein